MNAIISTGGKQYKVIPGNTLKVEKLYAEIGDNVSFPLLLAYGEGSTQIGYPHNGKVTATILEHGRHDKITIVKMRRRKHYRKTMGHRQAYTLVQVNDIVVG